MNSYGKYVLAAILVLQLASLAFAQSGLSTALISLCNMAKTVLGIGAMLMIIMAGLIYAVGQILGAETRARAAVWATAMLTGAVIGIIIYIITPVVVQALLAGDTNISVSC